MGSYIEDDFNRLIKYAQSLGIRVSIKTYDGRGAGAGWITDGTEIILFKWNRVTTTLMILNLLHELAHHLAWVYADRQTGADVVHALRMEDNRTNKTQPTIPKHMRKLIYEDEKYDSQYREFIAKEVGIRIPLWKIKADIELDIWDYKVYYETGEHPSTKELKLKAKEIKGKYRNGKK